MATKTLTATAPAAIRTHHLPSKSSSNKVKSHSTPNGNTATASSTSSLANDPIGNLKALYAPAARAFVRRDLVLTQTLIEASFPILLANPPSSVSPSGDALTSLRRKWDLLRITLETTAFTSLQRTSPSTTPLKLSAREDEQPFASSSLQTIISVEPSALITSLVTRSQILHTPKGQQASTMYLPTSIISALAYAALKLDCTENARSLIENWLALRVDALASQSSLEAVQPNGHGNGTVHLNGHADPNGHGSPVRMGVMGLVDTSMEGYEKILDVYCLQVLPRLGEWDYAMEFLKYEPELSLEKRKHVYTSLKTLHTQVMNPVAPAPRPPPTPSSRSPRESPASSATATPRPGVLAAEPTPSNRHLERASSSLSSASSSSLNSQQTIKASDYPSSALVSAPKTSNKTALTNGHDSPNASHSASKSRSRSRSPKTQTPLPSSPDIKGKGREISTTNTTPSSKSTTSSAHSHSRTLTPSSFPRPPLAPPLDDPALPLNTRSHLHSHSSRPGSGSLLRPGIIETLRMYISESLTLRDSDGRVLGWNKRMLGALFVLLGVLVPVVTYIAKLKRGVGVGRRSSRVVPGLSSGGASSLALRARGRPGTASSASLVKWVYESIKDTVVMAGKGLV